MKKIFVLGLVCVSVMTFFVACGNNSSNPQDNEMVSSEKTSSISDDSSSSVSSSSSSSYSSSTRNSFEHYCDASGCTKEGTHKEVGLGGNYEYYCDEHYQEIQDIISEMEQDVGSGSASMHTCEECSKEGTHELEGFSGQTEYYCTEHYNEIMNMLSEMLGE